MAVPTLVGVGVAATSAAPTSLAPALPASLQVGDIVLVAATNRANNGSALMSISGGTGSWTQIIAADGGGTQGGVKLWWKAWVSGDPNPTVTYTGSPDSSIAQCVGLRGCDTTAPIDVTGSVSSWGSQQDIGPIAGITPTVSDAGVIVFGYKRDDWTGVATLSGDGYTWTELGEPSTTLGTDAGMVWDLGTLVGAATAVTAKTFTVTGGAGQQGQGFVFSLKPVAAVATNQAAMLV